MKNKVLFMLIILLASAFMATGFTFDSSAQVSADELEPLTRQIWAVSVSAYPGESASLSMSGEAAYGNPANVDDEDYVGNYFNIEQETYVSQGETKRYIDISSPESNGYLYEDTTVVGMAKIVDSFSMMNTPAGSESATTWWDLF